MSANYARLRKLSVTQPTLPRIPGLDGLRAVAILMVIYSHAVQTYHWNSVVPFVWRLTPGATGVTIFFVLSGYLITTLLLHEHRTRGRIHLAKFYARRLWRIMPAYLVFLVIIKLLASTGTVDADWHSFSAALLFVGNYLQQPWILGHTWSLAVEQQFYLLFPLLLLWGLRPKNTGALFVILVATLGIAVSVRWLSKVQGVWPVNTDYSFEGRADALAIGCLCAIFQQRAQLQPLSKWQLQLERWALPLSTTLVLIAIALPAGIARALLHNTLLSLATALVIHACTTQPGLLLTRALETKPLRAIGLISYSLYLWQQLWLTPGLNIALPWALLGAVTTGAASYWLVEQPALRLRRPTA